MYGSPNWWFLMMIGRLQPHMSSQRAIAQLQPVFQRAAYEGIGKPGGDERPPRLYFSATGGIEKLRESLTVSLAGIVLGLPLAVAGARLLSSMLFGLKPTDLLTFVGALAGVVAVAPRPSAADPPGPLVLPGQAPAGPPACVRPATPAPVK